MTETEQLLKDIERADDKGYSSEKSIRTANAKALALVAIQLERLNQFLELMASGKLGGFNVQ